MNATPPSFALILPTRNPGALFDEWCAALAQQTVQPAQVVIMDSASGDDTVQKARAKGFTVHEIVLSDFNHGGTRNLGVDLLRADIEIAVFMTQDALLHDAHALSNLLAVFADKNIAAAYGRQLPHADANPLATHARFFNYPDTSVIKSRADIPELGIKAAFLSNAFAAYRLSVFRELDGFPEDVILGEDMHLTARMILAGYKVAYCAEACVRHSHNYSVLEEMRRYFDTGVFHQQASWIGEAFGRAGGEGRRFVLSEWRYLWRHAPWWLPLSCVFTFCKLACYQLGRRYRRLPKRWLPFFSMHKAFWLKQNL